MNRGDGSSIDVQEENEYYIDDSIINRTSGIEDLELSVSDWKKLKEIGIDIIADLISKSGWYIYNYCPVLNYRHIRNIAEKMKQCGFYFFDCDKPFYSIEAYVQRFKVEDESLYKIWKNEGMNQVCNAKYVVC